MFKVFFARNVGVILLIAQISNFIFALPKSENKWTIGALWQAYATLPFTNLLTWTFTIILAVFMITTNRFFYKTVLITLAYYIFLHLVDFNHRVDTNGYFSTIGAIIGNGVFFAVILRYYLLLRQQPVVAFDGAEPWGRITKITDSHVHMKKLNTPPDRVLTDLIELEVDSDFIVKLKYDDQQGDVFIFKRVS